MAAEYQTLAAVVKFVFFLSSYSFRILPAPNNSLQLTTCAAIREVELGSIAAERYVNNIEPPITKEFVLIPAGLPLDSLSAPITNPAARAMIMSIRNSSCRPICQFSNILSGIYKSIYKSYYYGYKTNQQNNIRICKYIYKYD